MSERLLELADAAGIERRYWDALGTERVLDDETAAAVLAAMGVGADGGASSATAADEAALPPVWIVTCGDDGTAGPVVEVPISFPAGAREQIDWVLELESGAAVHGVTTLRDAGNAASASATRGIAALHEIDGTTTSGLTRIQRCAIDFGAALPLGYHRLQFDSARASLALIVAPFRCWLPPALVAGKRVWGIAVQLYALRSARNWGIGDFTDLSVLARIAGAAGAALIGLNPLHARHLAQPDAASPYWPSSRLFLDPMCIDVEQVDDFDACAEARAGVAEPAFQSRLRALREAPLVDHAGVSVVKLRVLRQLHSCYRSSGVRDASRDSDFTAFTTAGGEALARFAEFEALRLAGLATGAHRDLGEAHAVGTGAAAGVDEERAVETGAAARVDEARAVDARRALAQHPYGERAALARFRRHAADDIDFQLYLQWQASLQLDRATVIARASGLSLSLYRDLAVGAAADSAETWSDPELVAVDISIGAPPDRFARDGQKWGLPPWSPRVLEARAYRPFAALLAANMRGAGALRIDHVMALARLFWIPAHLPGTRGCYVRNSFAALAAIVALESVRNHCAVIGEDLGSVPDGLRERLDDRGFLSYRVLIFERHWDGDGRFKRPWDYPAQALAMVATHDMATIADFWAGTDIERRARLGLYPEPRMADEERGRRAAERDGLLALLHEIDLAPADPRDPAQIADALHAVIGRTPAMLAVAQLDDVLGETEPVNIPGTDGEYPNWRRKLSLPLEQLATDPRLARLATIMRDAGRA